MEYSQQEQKEILAIANLICDFNMRKAALVIVIAFFPMLLRLRLRFLMRAIVR